MSIQAYAAKEKGNLLESISYEPAPLGPKDIEVKITHCGLCHSDVHLINNDWQFSTYPMVPGHEIVGTITEIGAEVSLLKKGQRVGVGWQRSACLECEFCIRGDENLCADNQATCVGNYGGFASAIRTDSRFAFEIPESLSSENVAPLLCGGITVFSPLRTFDIRPTMKVGVIGIGGLGHLALQFARAFGCEVTAFSSSLSKEKEARQFGAHRFVSSIDEASMEKMVGTQDIILATANADLNWSQYIQALRPDGKLCFLGVPESPIQFQAFELLSGRKSVCASPIGSRTQIREMLEFAARHQIVAKTETLPMKEINTAIEKVKANQARYRMVLEAV